VPCLCELYPGICLTTEKKHVKTSVRVLKPQAIKTYKRQKNSVSLISCPRACQLYLTESMHSPGHSVTVAGSETQLKGHLYDKCVWVVGGGVSKEKGDTLQCQLLALSAVPRLYDPTVYRM